jgi:pimeloyl-ACP methyl ester carboxylesterase
MRLLSIALAALLVGCSGLTSPAPSGGGTAPSAVTSASPSSSGAHPPDGLFDVGGYRMWITCAGEGSPTVILDAGLGSGIAAWAGVRLRVAATTRVCAYDRPGIGRSDARPDRQPRSAGAMADEAWRLFQAAGLTESLVLVGHSYGGLIDRLIAHEHPAAIAGLVQVDAATTAKFQGDLSFGDLDGLTQVDRDATDKEFSSITTLGDVPLVVMTQGQMSEPFQSYWSAAQDAVAALSTNALHLVARSSDHGIPDKAAALVVEATRAVVEAVRSAGPLPTCGPKFEAVGAECLKTTMSDQVAAWQALRASVVPAAGSFPAGTYRAELSADLVEQVTGDRPDWQVEIETWTLAKGHWSLEIVDDGGSPDRVEDVYMASKDELLVRVPEDWTIPRTPGVNRLHWTVDPNGTVQFSQIDTEAREPAFAVPWTRVGDPSVG